MKFKVVRLVENKRGELSLHDTLPEAMGSFTMEVSDAKCGKRELPGGPVVTIQLFAAIQTQTGPWEMRYDLLLHERSVDGEGQ